MTRARLILALCLLAAVTLAAGVVIAGGGSDRPQEDAARSRDKAPSSELSSTVTSPSAEEPATPTSGTGPTAPSEAATPGRPAKPAKRGGAASTTTSTTLAPGTSTTVATVSTSTTVAGAQTAPGVGIWLAAADGTNPQRLVADPEPTSGGGPSWSPDGKLIAFVAADRALWVVAPDGTGRRRLASGPAEPRVAEGASVAWGGDGRLAYATWNGIHGTVHVVKDDGSGDLVLSPPRFPRVVALGFSPNEEVFFSDGRHLYRSFTGDCEEADLPPAECTDRTGKRVEDGDVVVGEGLLALGYDGQSLLAAGGGKVAYRDNIETVVLASPGPVESLAWLDHQLGYAFGSGSSVTVARAIPGDPRPAPPLVRLDHAGSPAWMPVPQGSLDAPLLFVELDAGGGRQGIGRSAADGSGRVVLLAVPPEFAVRLAGAVSPSGETLVYSLVSR